MRRPTAMKDTNLRQMEKYDRRVNISIDTATCGPQGVICWRRTSWDSSENDKGWSWESE
jgi:hypothetical protein